MSYKTKIGLEIHVQPRTKSKLFCRCANEFNTEEPNKNICEICTGQPGALPMINQKALESIIKLGLALNCEISSWTHWDRKHYFYPDLPKGYQITQNENPLCRKGSLWFEYKDEAGKLTSKEVTINRIHLEEDAGKDLHPKGADYSLIDYNRAGAPLIELVTEPVIENKEQATEFCRNLQQIFRYLDISDADMEKGQMRLEVNISLGENGKTGTKVEVKNINSFKGVFKSIEYEIERQTEILTKGENVLPETRGWDAEREKTISQRSKEEAHDYRYFPEPDVPPMNITGDWISQIKNTIGELPQAKRERLKKEYGLEISTIEILINNLVMVNYFENTVTEIKSWVRDNKKVKEKDIPGIIKLTANYLITEIAGLILKNKVDFKDLKITPENLAELMIVVYLKEINSSSAQEVLREMFLSGGDPSQIIKTKNLKVEQNPAVIKKAVQEVIEENQTAVKDIKEGKEKALQFLVGKVMGKMKGKADPAEVIALIKQEIA